MSRLSGFYLYSNTSSLSKNGGSSTSSVISVTSHEIQGGLSKNNPNFTMEDGNDGTMFPKTTPSILLHAHT